LKTWKRHFAGLDFGVNEQGKRFRFSLGCLAKLLGFWFEVSSQGSLAVQAELSQRVSPEFESLPALLLSMQRRLIDAGAL